MRANTKGLPCAPVDDYASLYDMVLVPLYIVASIQAGSDVILFLRQSCTLVGLLLY
jgi:hypothetical protein